MIRIESVNPNGSIDAVGNNDDETKIKALEYPKQWDRFKPIVQGSSFFNTVTKELIQYDEDSETWC